MTEISQPDGARLRLARRVFYRLPLRLRQAAGDLIYRHLA